LYIADRGNHRIQVFDLSANFDSAFGREGSEDGQFSSPYDVEVDSSDNIYVADYGNNRIQKFDSSGTYVAKVGTEGSGDGEFSSPHGVEIDSSGNIYVADYGNHRVQKFDSDGDYLLQWGSEGSGEGLFKNPMSVAADNSDYIYISDKSYRDYDFDIQKFSNTGVFQLRITHAQLDESVSGLSIDSSGNIFAVLRDFSCGDYGDRVVKFDSSGDYITHWGSYGEETSEFNNPFGIDISSDSYVYVADTDNHRIQKFETDGTFVLETGSEGSEDGQFNSPRGVAVMSDGSLLVADTGNHRIQKLSYDDLSPSISTTTSISATNDNTPSFSGTTTDSLSNISSLQYQIDSTSGSWTDCSADDGSFDETDEAYTCTIGTELEDGVHTIYFKGTDSSDNSSTTFTSSTFTVDTVGPTSSTDYPYKQTSLSGFTATNITPSLSFNKAADTTTSVTSYSVELDGGKNKSFSLSNIPTNGNGAKEYIWKNNENVKVIFCNEEDSKTSNDEIKVEFKGLKEIGGLSEGKHVWKVCAKDRADNQTCSQAEINVDQTKPVLSDLALDYGLTNYSPQLPATMLATQAINKDGEYILSSYNRMPLFSGRVEDIYKGSVKEYSGGAKDTFEKVSSGPEKLTLKIKKKSDGIIDDYYEYIEEEYTLGQIIDKKADESLKQSRFYVQTPFPLEDGYYRAIIELEDGAGNKQKSEPFYLSLNYTGGDNIGGGILNNVSSIMNNVLGKKDKNLEHGTLNLGEENDNKDLLEKTVKETEGEKSLVPGSNVSPDPGTGNTLGQTTKKATRNPLTYIILGLLFISTPFLIKLLK